MAPKPIEIVKKGYERLQKQVEAWKKSLQECLAKNEQLSEADSNWLDNEGNTVDEMVLLDKLEKESDYGQAVERLELQQRHVLNHLMALGGDGQGASTAGAKRKWPEKKQGDPAQKSEMTTAKKANKNNEPVPKRTQNVTIAQHIEVLDYLNGPGKGNQTKTANHFAEK
ncbi:tigger transposable element derived 4 [Moniliophthora roreri MCA 2997]|uniref:Tigger transposable element derived 4 n=1 Tax=Moniliophthora roreri (strain MCA 2997) TaxID=1381753 RepID=V2WNX5_MONRO|nr:tigger transposable element derived 4 [Moniliophthora roreri MCA 2997]